jgi:hypothetical protein
MRVLVVNIGSSTTKLRYVHDGTGTSESFDIEPADGDHWGSVEAAVRSSPPPDAMGIA